MNALLAGLRLGADNLATRHLWIGGSDANAIMGGNPDKLIRLWREKRGEADDRMMQAYDLIWEVQQTHKSLGIEPEFRALLKQIEAADEVLAEEITA